MPYPQQQSIQSLSEEQNQHQDQSQQKQQNKNHYRKGGRVSTSSNQFLVANVTLIKSHHHSHHSFNHSQLPPTQPPTKLPTKPQSQLHSHSNLLLSSSKSDDIIIQSNSHSSDTDGYYLNCSPVFLSGHKMVNSSMASSDQNFMEQLVQEMSESLNGNGNNKYSEKQSSKATATVGDKFQDKLQGKECKSRYVKKVGVVGQGKASSAYCDPIHHNNLDKSNQKEDMQTRINPFTLTPNARTQNKVHFDYSFENNAHHNYVADEDFERNKENMEMGVISDHKAVKNNKKKVQQIQDNNKTAVKQLQQHRGFSFNKKSAHSNRAQLQGQQFQKQVKIPVVSQQFIQKSIQKLLIEKDLEKCLGGSGDYDGRKDCFKNFQHSSQPFKSSSNSKPNKPKQKQYSSSSCSSRKISTQSNHHPKKHRDPSSSQKIQFQLTPPRASEAKKTLNNPNATPKTKPQTQSTRVQQQKPKSMQKSYQQSQQMSSYKKPTSTGLQLTQLLQKRIIISINNIDNIKQSTSLGRLDDSDNDSNNNSSSSSSSSDSKYDDDDKSYSKSENSNQSIISSSSGDNDEGYQSNSSIVKSMQQQRKSQNSGQKVRQQNQQSAVDDDENKNKSVLPQLQHQKQQQQQQEEEEEEEVNNNNYNIKISPQRSQQNGNKENVNVNAYSNGDDNNNSFSHFSRFNPRLIKQAVSRETDSQISAVNSTNNVSNFNQNSNHIHSNGLTAEQYPTQSVKSTSSSIIYQYNQQQQNHHNRPLKSLFQEQNAYNQQHQSRQQQKPQRRQQQSPYGQQPPTSPSQSDNLMFVNRLKNQMLMNIPSASIANQTDYFQQSGYSSSLLPSVSSFQQVGVMSKQQLASKQSPSSSSLSSSSSSSMNNSPGKIKKQNVSSRSPHHLHQQSNKKSDQDSQNCGKFKKGNLSKEQPKQDENQEEEYPKVTMSSGVETLRSVQHMANYENQANFNAYKVKPSSLLHNPIPTVGPTPISTHQLNPNIKALIKYSSKWNQILSLSDCNHDIGGYAIDSADDGCSSYWPQISSDQNHGACEQYGHNQKATKQISQQNDHVKTGVDVNVEDVSKKSDKGVFSFNDINVKNNISTQKKLQPPPQLQQQLQSKHSHKLSNNNIAPNIGTSNIINHLIRSFAQSNKMIVEQDSEQENASSTKKKMHGVHQSDDDQVKDDYDQSNNVSNNVNGFTVYDVPVVDTVCTQKQKIRDDNPETETNAKAKYHRQSEPGPNTAAYYTKSQSVNWPYSQSTGYLFAMSKLEQMKGKIQQLENASNKTCNRLLIYQDSKIVLLEQNKAPFPTNNYRFQQNHNTDINNPDLQNQLQKIWNFSSISARK